MTGKAVRSYVAGSNIVPGTRRWLSTSRHDLAKPGVTIKTREHSPGNLIATITVSNPAKLNIVNTSLLAQLVDACRELSSDAQLRAVVLTGGPTAAGKQPSFIGGADIAEMHHLSTSEEARDFIEGVHSACKAIRDIPVPVIARVHGFCLGAGLEIMAACDLRVATRSSSFGMPEVKVGIPSVVEAALLPGLIGMGRTRRLLYLAETIDAATAEDWGLIERLVADEPSLDEAVRDWADVVAAMGPLAIRSQKRLIKRWENGTVDEGIHAGVDAFAEAYADGGLEPKLFMGRFVDRKR
ncbi:hypothetical protein LTR56_007100 [Elasticomyces elasticus]|nr:hypothetical protein LTR56_007100 [Elasticomyces elasticus]KAK3652076.1 hypothetical protein LTR22_011865 [Elasticomyces elasticus]KAK4917832.1 hypothetical protein LTR49_014369 [Elasticomyces elasticus]KAK5750504.1 hypothetical protein LTS12_019462 [Elasticomyces elasticus]